MSQVDPFQYPIPESLKKDPQTLAYFDYLNKWCHQIWLRTGGSEDFVADTEATVVSNDGGNRTNRFLRDEIDNLWSHILENKKKDYKSDIDELRDMFYDLKRSVRPVDTSFLENQIADLKRQNSFLRQLVYEIIERYDSGT